MANKLNIGIAGCGAIGTSLAKFIAVQLGGRAKISGLFDVDPLKSLKLSRELAKNRPPAVKNLAALVARSDLVVECACARASFDIAKSALNRGRSIMIMSAAGAAGNLKKLRALAVKNNARVYIPSGAISGVDALKAAAIGKIRSVTLTTYKNPRSFQGVDYIKRRRIDLTAIKRDKTLFYGPAKQAVKHFPRNINVAAVLSMAGIGQEKTMIRIVAQPKAKKNIHEVRVVSAAADIIARTENILHPDNPKTSYLAVLSAASCLKQILDPVRIGT